MCSMVGIAGWVDAAGWSAVDAAAAVGLLLDKVQTAALFGTAFRRSGFLDCAGTSSTSELW